MPSHSTSYAKLCLLLLARSTTAIIAGTDAPKDAAPYAAALLTKGASESSSLICNGALIGPKAVLTTAECVDNQSTSSLGIRLGSLDRTTGGELKHAAKITTHPDYDAGTLNANVAIIQLTEEVSDIQPAILADASPRSGKKLTLFGWGSTDRFSETPSRSLQQIGALASAEEACRKDWGDVRELPRNVICDVPDAGVGACRGDEGGPVVSEEDGKLVALITSLNQCTQWDHPSVDVDVTVSVLRDWILGALE